MKNLSVPRWMLLGADGAGWLPNVTLIANDLTGGNRKRVINNEVIHQDRKSTRLNSSHGYISYAVFCLKKKKTKPKTKTKTKKTKKKKKNTSSQDLKIVMVRSINHPTHTRLKCKRKYNRRSNVILRSGM